MVRKILIALFTFCAAGSVELSAQNAALPRTSPFIVKIDQPESFGAADPGEPKNGVPASSGLSGIDMLIIPKPYNDLQLDLRLKTDPLPAYYSVGGLYKLDCVYIKEHEYFNMWETNKLNPYGFNGEHFNGSVTIRLFDQDITGSWHSPLDRTIVTSDFGLRRATWHYGIDIRVKTGMPVYSVFEGVVRITGYDRYGFGRFILIRHKNGLETLYGHLSKSMVVLGQEVKAGEIIGHGGNSGRSTAPHLHFEVRYHGNALDPNKLFDFQENTILSSEYMVNHESFAYLEEANKIRYHVIRRGDTLSGLSYRYGVSIGKMCNLNGISRNSILRIGQRVRIN